MNTTTITPAQIFDLNQVLTLDIAKTLVGKPLATTYCTDRANRAVVELITIVGFHTEYDLAAQEPLNGYTSRAAYWDEKHPDQAKKAKETTLLILEDGRQVWYRARLNGHNKLNNSPVFECADEDRDVYYTIL